MAPHIMICEPIEPHHHRNLYHSMVTSEKQIQQSRTNRLRNFTHSIAKKAAQCLSTCPHTTARKFRAHLPTITGQHQTPDAEKEDALLLFQHSKMAKLACNYRANASSENLIKRKKSHSNATTLVDEEPESGEIIAIRSSVSYSAEEAYTPLKETSVVT
ncbi:MAG: hypothetical protein Q9226_002261, partial [Calogaya cf. arnoldii]